MAGGFFIGTLLADAWFELLLAVRGLDERFVVSRLYVRRLKAM